MSESRSTFENPLIAVNCTGTGNQPWEKTTPRAAEGLTNISLRDPKDREHAPEPTPRQRQVIQLLAEGRSMKEVASRLKITKRTVAAHKYAVMEQLQLKTNAELVQYAIKNHIISI